MILLSFVMRNFDPQSFERDRAKTEKHESTSSVIETEPKVNSESIPIPPGTIEKGRKIFERIKTNYRRAEISIWGAASSSPKVALWIPESEWKSLPSVERGNLGYYVKSHVPIFRTNPGPHTGISSSAPIYSQLVSNCRRMSDDAWCIGVGAYNAEGNLLYDHEAVTGSESPWRTNAIPK